MITEPNKNGRAKLFAIIAAVMVAGLALTAQAAGLTGILAGAHDATDTQVDPSDITLDVVVDLPEELEEALNAELEAVLRLNLIVRHELGDAVALCETIRTHADRLLEIGLSLDGEARERTVATAQAVIAELDALDEMLQAELASWTETTDAVEAAADGTGETLEAALQGELDAAESLQAQIDVILATLDEVETRLTDSFDNVKTGIFGSVFTSKDEATKTVDLILADVDEIRASMQLVGTSLTDVAAQAVRCLLVLVDVEGWLKLNVTGLPVDVPVVAVAVAKNLVLIECLCPGEEEAEPQAPKEPEPDPTKEPEPAPTKEPEAPKDTEPTEEPAVPDDVVPSDGCLGPMRINAHHSGPLNVVSWSAVSGAEAYHLYRAEGDAGFELYTTTEGDQTTHRDSEVEIGEQYRYRVSAVVGGEETDICHEVEITAIPVFSSILAAAAAAAIGLGGYGALRRRV